MQTLTYWIRELAYSLRAAERDGDLAGHLAAWWEVVTGQITPDTRFRLKEASNGTR